MLSTSCAPSPGTPCTLLPRIHLLWRQKAKVEGIQPSSICSMKVVVKTKSRTKVPLLLRSNFASDHLNENARFYMKFVVPIQEPNDEYLDLIGGKILAQKMETIYDAICLACLTMGCNLLAK